MKQHYAVWQIDGAVYGIGTTARGAFENALEWLDQETSEDDVWEVDAQAAPVGALVVAPCSAALAAAVKLEGGLQTVELDDDSGYLVLAEEL